MLTWSCTFIYGFIPGIFYDLQVMSIKAIGIAIKLTLEGFSQAAHYQTWVFVMIAVTCIITQLNYLNKVCNFLTVGFSQLMMYFNSLRQQYSL